MAIVFFKCEASSPKGAGLTKFENILKYNNNKGGKVDDLPKGYLPVIIGSKKEEELKKPEEEKMKEKKKVYPLREARKSLIKEINAEMALKKKARINKLLEEENEKELKPLIGKKVKVSIDIVAFPGPDYLDVIGILKTVELELITLEINRVARAHSPFPDDWPKNGRIYKSRIQKITEL
ncbi:MAG: hypothetical protein WC499_04260 [Patescibacteria group bacterium]